MDMLHASNLPKKIANGEAELNSCPYITVEYYYDNSGYYAYILLNANDKILYNIKDELIKNNINVLHYGKSHKEANNGRQYQWFIRVGEGDKKPFQETIESFFTTVFMIFSDEQKAKNQLEDLIKERDYIKLELENTQKDNREKEKQREEYIIKYHKSEKSVKETEEFNELLEHEIKLLNDKNTELEKNIEKLKEDNLKLQLNNTQKSINEVNKNITIIETKKHNIFKEIINTMFPDFTFLRGSEDVLVQEYDDIKPSLHMLRDLAYNPINVMSKRFQRAPNFKEWRRSGKSSERIYFRDDGNGKYSILISHKDLQKRDEGYLSSI